jgi:hypothetical protein
VQVLIGAMFATSLCALALAELHIEGTTGRLMINVPTGGTAAHLAALTGQGGVFASRNQWYAARDSNPEPAG